MYAVIKGHGREQHRAFSAERTSTSKVVQNMSIVAVLSYLLLLTSWVVCLKDPTLSDIFFPFGTDVADSTVPAADDGSSPAINVSEGFTFFAVGRNTAYVSRLLFPNFDIRTSSPKSLYPSRPTPACISFFFSFPRKLIRPNCSVLYQFWEFSFVYIATDVKRAQIPFELA